MIKFATSFARSGFGLGIAIGLMVTIHLHSFVQAMPMMAADTSCDTILDVPPEVQAFVDLQCLVNDALFDDGLEPSTAYAIETAVTEPGAYAGETYDGRGIWLDAVFVVKADLENEAPELIEEGVSAYLVVAMLYGDAGEVPIAGVVMKTGTFTPDNEFLLLVCDILSEEDYSIFANVSRSAGLGGGPLTGQALRAEMVWLPEADLGAARPEPITLVTFNPEVSGIADGVNTLLCETFANARYQVALDAAERDLAICLAGILLLFFACVGGCALAGPLWSVCSLGCAAGLAIGIGTCTALAVNALFTARQQLELDLLACNGIMYY